MNKVELQIVALAHSMTQSQNYAVVLGEKEGARRLPIVIGGFEAQAIAVAMEKLSPNRPLTHDLLKNAFDAFGIYLREIVISNLVDGIFYSKLVCDRDGEVIEIDSRTSDAIALAVRYECPIYTYEFILEAAGVILEEPDAADRPKKKEPKKKKEDLSTLSLDDLQSMLDEALGNEDYEKAAKIRDELNHRKQLGQ